MSRLPDFRWKKSKQTTWTRAIITGAGRDLIDILARHLQMNSIFHLSTFKSDSTDDSSMSALTGWHRNNRYDSFEGNKHVPESSLCFYQYELLDGHACNY